MRSLCCWEIKDDFASLHCFYIGAFFFSFSFLSSSLSEELKTEEVGGGVFLGDLITFLPLLHLLFLLFLFRMCEGIIHISNSASLPTLCRISSLLLFPSLALSHLKLCSLYRFPLTLDASCNCNKLSKADVPNRSLSLCCGLVASSCRCIHKCTWPTLGVILSSFAFLAVPLLSSTSCLGCSLLWSLQCVPPL